VQGKAFERPVLTLGREDWGVFLCDHLATSRSVYHS
jgi:hypothetical protein